jgi:hypothetical protein
MPAGEIRLAQLLRELRRAGKTTNLPEKAPLLKVQQVALEYEMEYMEAALVSRGPTPYKVMPTNLVLADERFETGLTGWTEAITATGTTAHHKLSDLYSAIEWKKNAYAGLKLDMTTSGASGQRVARIYEDMTVVAASIYSAEMWLAATALTANIKGVMTIRWYDISPSEVGTADTVDITVASATPVLTQLLNKTAPTGAVTADLEIELQSTAASAVGTLYSSLPLFHLGSTIEAWATRIIPGESKV